MPSRVITLRMDAATLAAIDGLDVDRSKFIRGAVADALSDDGALRKTYEARKDQRPVEVGDVREVMREAYERRAEAPEPASANTKPIPAKPASSAPNYRKILMGAATGRTERQIMAETGLPELLVRKGLEKLVAAGDIRVERGVYYAD